MSVTPLFIVLELDEPHASEVIQLRRACGDAFRASLPAEITLTGSTGVGPLLTGQDLEAIEQALNDVAETTPSIQATFGPVLRFPGTDVFVFTIHDETVFRTIHQTLISSQLKFEASPFPFQPHCTLSSNPVAEAETAQRLTIRLDQPFTLSTIALYGLHDGQVARLAARTLKTSS